jgi:hypothetical protein
MNTTTNMTPVLVSVIYTDWSSYSAELRLRCHTTGTQSTTIIHETAANGADSFEAEAGREYLLPVSDGESITVIVRDQGTIVAAGLFEVQIALAEELGAVLASRLSFNLMVDQCDAALIERAMDRALTTTTQELIEVLTKDEAAEVAQ